MRRSVLRDRPGAMNGDRAYRTLDKDLDQIGRTESAQTHAFRPVWRLGAGMLVMVGALLVALALSDAAPAGLAVAAGLVVAVWLGTAIGSNDVANSLGPAVGAGAIGLLPGLCLVAVAGIAGAVLAGGAVSDRLARGIVAAGPMVADARAPVMMVAALIGAAAWITLATGIGLPVSTSHSIVGGIAGAGVVAFGAASVAWPTLAMIAGVWVATPVLSAGLAAAILILLRVKVIAAPDRADAARRWLPGMIGAICGLFGAYLLVLMDRGGAPAIITAIVAGAAGWAWTRARVAREVARHPDRPRIKVLLRPALVMAVAILGFAHGANDVSNIAGPLSVVLAGVLPAGDAPLILLGGGLSIAVGTLLFGRRLVGMVGSGITRLNAGRAFCVSLSTAIVVLGASWLGLPVSTTHVAVGGVFGVGFAREWLEHRRDAPAAQMPPEEARRRVLIRRSHVVTITLAWLVTLPVTGALGALACLLVLWATGV